MHILRGPTNPLRGANPLRHEGGADVAQPGRVSSNAPVAAAAPDGGAPTPSQRSALAALTVALGIAALFVLRSLLPSLVVGAWFAGLAAPLIGRLARRFGHRRRLAAIATATLVLALLAPLLLLALPLAALAGDALTALTRAASAGTLGRWLDLSGVGAGGSAQGTAQRLWAAVQQFAPSAAGIASRTFAAVSTGVLQLLTLVASAYVFSAHGEALVAVARRGSPLAPAHFDRIAGESLRVARALLVGGLLTSAAQGLIAYAVYLSLGITNASALAALTGVASMVPVVGSALVWAPVCVVLVGAGHVRDAAILAACGAGFISTVDNVLRPLLARLGAHEVHPLVLFLGVVGGISALGPSGLIVGPLALSLFVSAYRLRAEAWQ